MGFCEQVHDRLAIQQTKVDIRSVIPGYINYRYKDGVIPGHTKVSFKEYGILTIHSIIAKNSLILMHKIKHHSTYTSPRISKKSHAR